MRVDHGRHGDQEVLGEIHFLHDVIVNRLGGGTGYFLQKAGVRIARTVISSSLPSSIVTEHTHVWKSVSIAKVVAGPTSCSPGPMLLSEATAAEKAVRTSSPENVSSSVTKTSVASHAKKNARTAN